MAQNAVLNVSNHPKYIYDLVNFMSIKRSEQMANPHNDFKKSNHMCTIIDTNGNPLIFGSNFYLTKNNDTIHAEVDAFNKLINKMGRMKRKITIDIIVIRTNGGNSMPCTNCMKKIFDMNTRFNIRYIYFTNNNFDIDVIKFSKLSNRTTSFFSIFSYFFIV
jgi:cytidine deaminase